MVSRVLNIHRDRRIHGGDIRGECSVWWRSHHALLPFIVPMYVFVDCILAMETVNI